MDKPAGGFLRSNMKLIEEGLVGGLDAQVAGQNQQGLPDRFDDGLGKDARLVGCIGGALARRNVAERDDDARDVVSRVR